MGFELEALRGGATRLLRGPSDAGAATPSGELRPLVCSVMLDELKFDRGGEDLRRLVAIVSLLRASGFNVEAWVRDHGEAAQRSTHRVLLQRIQFGQLSQVARRAKALPVERRQQIGF